MGCSDGEDLPLHGGDLLTLATVKRQAGKSARYRVILGVFCGVMAAYGAWLAALRFGAPDPQKETNSIEVDMLVSRGNIVELWVNDWQHPPEDLPVVVGERHVYQFKKVPREVTLIRLDPTEQPDARIVIYSLAVKSGDRIVRQFGPAEMKSWTLVNLSTPREQNGGLVLQDTNDDPIVWTPVILHLPGINAAAQPSWLRVYWPFLAALGGVLLYPAARFLERDANQPKSEAIGDPTARALAAKQSQGRAPERFYLPQLDGLRFVAFCLVFAHHLPRVDFSITRFTSVQTVLLRLNTFGWMGVDVFFCLSAFLITSLLLREQMATGSLSIWRFYLRRALRVWPLYFLMLTLVFAVFPIFGYLGPVFGSPPYRVLFQRHFFPFVVFLGNFSYAYFTSSVTPPLGPLWSVSVEEQFYLVWPMLLLFLPKIGLRVFGCILGGLLALAIAVRAYIMIHAIPYPMVWVNTFARLDPLVLGTAVALLYARKPKLRYGWLAFPFSILVFALVTDYPQIGGSFHTIWQLSGVAVGSAAALTGILYARSSQAILGNRVLRWAGKLSYGFYVYHMIGQVVAWRFVDLTGKPGTPAFLLQSLLHILLSLAITIAIAAVSYYAFERWFLVLKNRYTVVASRSA